MNQKDIVREAAEESLYYFIQLVTNKKRVLGSVHQELIRWWTREGAPSHQLVLLPRDHQKSALIAFRVAWEITRNPEIRVLYISSTANLATKQLKFIKDILTSERYRFYWPEMINLEESKREKWTETEISVDHPARKAEAVRDPTIFTAGLTTGIVGLHCDIAVLDDVVVGENAYTKEGRSKVELQYSFLSSIESANAREWVVGTRYHPNDLYGTLLTRDVDQYDKDGSLIGTLPLYEVFERRVESLGDGTGEFLWPVQLRYDGKPFGFNKEILAKKRSQYLNKTQYRAQYYNDPNDPTDAAISPAMFQYYKREFLSRNEGRWFYKGKRLNVFASVDFAYSLNADSDYSCIVVVGIDANHNYYVLDIDRFKSNRVSEHFDHILRLHTKWDFRKLRAEVTAAQETIVETLKHDYIRPHGLVLTIDPHRPTKHQGTKEERIDAILEPRFNNGQVFFYEGGNTQILEEELVKRYPPHDDLKDALSTCIDICIPPAAGLAFNVKDRKKRASYHPRFGGVI